MASEETSIIELRDGFYRDSIGKVMMVLLSMCIAILIIIFLSVYLYLDKPAPVTFPMQEDMRVQKSVPLDQPYLLTPDLLQWVADVFPKAFTLDFNHYNDQLQTNAPHFTKSGWAAFLNQLNIYANYNNVQAYKIFVTATPGAAPIILRDGVLPDSGKYGWWVQMPVTINYAGYKPPPSVNLTFQILVVRVPTLDNLTGVGIDDVIQAPVATGNQAAGNQ
jgi:intracellular multiplication protein IcmL